MEFSWKVIIATPVLFLIAIVIESAIKEYL